MKKNTIPVNPKMKSPQNKLFDKVLEILDYSKKIIINISIIFIVALLIKFFISENNKTTLLIEPFIIPQKLIDDGYTGEMLTVKLLDKLNEIQNSSTSFEIDNNVVVPVSKEKYDNIRNINLGDEYNEIIALIIELFGKKPIIGIGMVNIKSDGFFITFRFEGKQQFEMSTNNLDDLLPVAEYIAEQYSTNQLAAFYAYRKDSVKCLETIQLLLTDNNPNNDQYAYFLRGRTYTLKYQKTRDTTDREIAIEMLEKSLEKGKINSPSYNMLGYIYESDDSLNRAKRMYKLAIENNNSFEGAYLNLGNIFYQEFLKNTLDSIKIDSALTCFYKANELNPKMYYGYISQGNLLFITGKKRESFKLFLKAMELEPKNPASYLQFGMLLAQDNEKKSALKYFNKVIELDSVGKFGKLAKSEIEKIEKHDDVK